CHRRSSRRLDIRVTMTPVAAVTVRRVKRESLVEKTIAGDVMIDADDTGRDRNLRQRPPLPFRHAALDQVRPERVLAIDSPAQRVPRQPAPLVLEIRLIANAWSGVDGP